MTPAEFRAARHALGLSCAKLAALWGMGEHGGRAIRRWESGERPVNPIAAFALGLMLERDPLPVNICDLPKRQAGSYDAF